MNGPNGPGKYDDELTAALASARSKSGGQIWGGVLIVRGADGHNGFCAQLDPLAMLELPAVLRSVADQIEAMQPGEAGAE